MNVLYIILASYLVQSVTPSIGLMEVRCIFSTTVCLVSFPFPPFLYLFVMFVVDSMLYVIVGSTTFSYNIYCILPSCLPTRMLSPIMFSSLTI